MLHRIDPLLSPDLLHALAAMGHGDRLAVVDANFPAASNAKRLLALPGVTAYGRTRKQATAAVQALALRLIADRLEHGEAVPGPMNVSFIAA